MNILFENDRFIIAFKPNGVDFHNNEDQIGFFNQVKAHCNLKELYPVHRLDKVTSGLIIMAKDIQAEHIFNALFQQHQIDKFYLAIAKGKPTKKQGLIEGDMAKSRQGAWKLLRTKDNPAKTRFYSFSTQPQHRLYVLKPYSGKTHQLRVAMKSLGTAILGDKLYKGEQAARTFLHAHALAFVFADTKYEFITPKHLIPEFALHLNQVDKGIIKTPWSLKW